MEMSDSERRKIIDETRGRSEFDSRNSSLAELDIVRNGSSAGTPSARTHEEGRASSGASGDASNNRVAERALLLPNCGRQPAARPYRELKPSCNYRGPKLKLTRLPRTRY